MEERRAEDNRVAKLEAVTATLVKDVDQLSQDIRNLAALIIKRTQTNWATLAAWAAVVVSIIVLVVASFSTDINRVESNLYDTNVNINKQVVVAANYEARLQALERSDLLLDMLGVPNDIH